jgi:protein-S-isoprenylcysteine O-methyltransferase Ste14
MRKLIIPPIFVLISLILIVIFYFVLPEFNWIPFPVNLIGILVSFTGFVIMGKSRDLFKKYKTTLAIKNSTSLIQEGIFLRTRNPMYVGMFLFLFGLGICSKNLISILIPFGCILILHFVFVLKEEKLLFDSFGQDYAGYTAKVKRWI